MTEQASHIIEVDFGAARAETAPSLFLVPRHENGAWWRSILAWVDPEDLGRGRGAYIWFMDLLVSRPAEFTALIGLFLVAYQNYSRHGGELTARQKQAVDLANEARTLRVNEAKYVSEHLGIRLSTAYELLGRAAERQSIAKILNFAEKPYKTDKRKLRGPTEREIQRKMSAYRHKCPGKGWNSDCEGRAYGDRGLCWPCYNRYGFEGERPPWLAYLVEDNRRKARAWALDSLTTIQVEDDEAFDALLAA